MSKGMELYLLLIVGSLTYAVMHLWATLEFVKKELAALRNKQ